MRYAARRTWPEKSKIWEYLGDSETVEDFALMFAEDKHLDADTEFVVIEKAGAESDIEFFKVSRTEPYTLMTAEPRVESASNPAPASLAARNAADDNPNGMGGGAEAIAGVWRAIFGNALFFGKVGAAAFLFFVTAVFLVKYWFNAW
jgi:hypothetical protein